MLELFDQSRHVLCYVLNVCTHFIWSGTTASQKLGDISLGGACLDLCLEHCDIITKLIVVLLELRVVNFSRDLFLQVIFLFVKLAELSQEFGEMLLDLDDVLAVVSILGSDSYVKGLLEGGKFSVETICDLLESVLDLINTDFILE